MKILTPKNFLVELTLVNDSHEYFWIVLFTSFQISGLNHSLLKRGTQKTEACHCYRYPFRTLHLICFLNCDPYR